jgi:hypothetical protein
MRKLLTLLKENYETALLLLAGVFLLLALFKPEIQLKQNVEGIDKPEFYDFIQTQKPAAKFVTGYSVRWIYLSLAALLILATYLPNLLSLRAGKRLVR